jgi:hypothetical protein
MNRARSPDSEANMAGFESPPPPKLGLGANIRTSDAVPNGGSGMNLSPNLDDYRMMSKEKSVQQNPVDSDVDADKQYQFKYHPQDAWKTTADAHGQLSIDVGGTSLPLKDGLNIWDLRSSVLTDLDAARDSWPDRGTQSNSDYPNIGDRYRERKPAVVLAWRLHF